MTVLVPELEHFEEPGGLAELRLGVGEHPAGRDELQPGVLRLRLGRRLQRLLVGEHERMERVHGVRLSNLGALDAGVEELDGMLGGVDCRDRLRERARLTKRVALALVVAGRLRLDDGVEGRLRLALEALKVVYGLLKSDDPGLDNLHAAFAGKVDDVADSAFVGTVGELEQ